MLTGWNDLIRLAIVRCANRQGLAHVADIPAAIERLPFVRHVNVRSRVSAYLSLYRQGGDRRWLYRNVGWGYWALVNRPPSRPVTVKTHFVAKIWHAPSWRVTVQQSDLMQRDRERFAILLSAIDDVRLPPFVQIEVAIEPHRHVGRRSFVPGHYTDNQQHLLSHLTDWQRQHIANLEAMASMLSLYAGVVTLSLTEIITKDELVA